VWSGLIDQAPPARTLKQGRFGGADTPRKRSQKRVQCENGAIAQLVERLNGIQEVRGSTPLGSTIFYNKISKLHGLIFESERPLTLAVPPRYQMEAIRGHQLALLFHAFKRSERSRLR
jgi:hypothetical protein